MPGIRLRAIPTLTLKLSYCAVFGLMVSLTPSLAQRTELNLSTSPGADPGPGIPACAEGLGWYSLFDGTKATVEKYWFRPSGQLHGNGGAWWIESGELYSNQNGAGQGGALYTRRSGLRHFEVKTDVRPVWGNDAGYFLRATTNNRSYQVTIDYLAGETKAIGGIWGESGLKSINRKPFGLNSATSITLRSDWFMNGSAPDRSPALTAADWSARIWKANDFNWVQARIYKGDLPWIDTWINGFHIMRYQDAGQVQQNNLTGYLALQVHGGAEWTSNNSPNRYRAILVRELKEDGTPLDAYPEWSATCATAILTGKPHLASTMGLGLGWERGADGRINLFGHAEAPFTLIVTNAEGRSVHRIRRGVGDFRHDFALPGRGLYYLQVQGKGLAAKPILLPPRF